MALKLPETIGFVSPDSVRRKHQYKIISRLPVLGEIDVDCMKFSDPVRDNLQLLCREHGFRLATKQPGPYSLYDYAFGAGSAFIHRDSGMGLTAGVLVATKQICKRANTYDPSYDEICQLVTRTGEIDVSVGQAFVFDANRPHAWLANCRWVIACHHVCRVRKTTKS